MEEDFYDEFGNYIGPDIDQSSDSDEARSDDQSRNESSAGQKAVRQSKFNLIGSLKQEDSSASPMIRDDQSQDEEEDYKGGYQVVLHEDK